MKTLLITIATITLGLSFSHCNKIKRCKEKCSYQIPANETPGSIAEATGEYSFGFSSSQTGAPFDQGSGADFFVSEDNELIVHHDGVCIKIQNPIKASANEVIFVDQCEFKCQFKVKRSGIEVSEIKVEDYQGELYGVFK